jgi:uncharacterized protein (DUF302 family)
MKYFTIAAAIAASCAIGTLLLSPAQAQEMISFETELPYDDVTFGLESAITDRGFVVDHISHVGAMLERTRADVGSDVVLFQQADVYSFCSAKLSRQVMEANPMNIAFCPYDIFVAQHPGEDHVTVGFRSFPAGEMQVIQSLLTEIAQEAIED